RCRLVCQIPVRYSRASARRAGDRAASHRHQEAARHSQAARKCRDLTFDYRIGPSILKPNSGEGPMPNFATNVSTDSNAVSKSAADAIVALAVETAAKKGSFTIALSGGSTPKSAYALMA